MQDQPTTTRTPSVEDFEIDSASSILERVIEGAITKVLPNVDQKVVFGDPVERDGITVIPVARVSHGYGFGAGSGRGIEADEAGGGGGGGGGGGLSVRPVGYIEMGPDGTQFKPILDVGALLTRIVPFIGLAMLLTIWLGRRE